MNVIRIRPLFVAAALAGSFVQAQDSAVPPTGRPTIQTAAQEVLVDVVVHDRKGRPVTDLKQSNFTIFDNGQQKTIKTFRLVEGADAVNASGERAKLDPLQQVRLITLLFDNLDLNSRRLARSAALDLLKTEFPQNVYLSVMTIGHKLDALQPFTSDRELLRKAVERATASETFDFAADSARIQNQLQNMLGGTSTNNTGATGPENQPNGSDVANQQMARMMLDTLQMESKMEMSLAGRVQIYSLLDAVKQQYELPGRKTVLYFSTGLRLPQSTDQAFEHLIGTANQNNVSIYCIDARGLITATTNHDAIAALNSAANASERQQVNPSGPVSKGQAEIMDTTLDSMRMNTQNNLATLAESTGGALIANTNDFRGPLRKLADDVETYYELSYDPQITNYDGSLHKIAVKVEPHELRVQARSEYFALPPSLHGTVLNAYEVPLLKALDSVPVPHEFVFRSAGIYFHGAQGTPICDIVLDVPLANVTLAENQQTKIYEGDLSYVAMVKDDQGKIAAKFSNEIPLKVPAEKVAALEKSHFIYTERVNLQPGHYRLEMAVLDRQGNKISARKATLFLPAPSDKLELSSVVPIRTMKPKDASADPADPLVVGNEAITPTLDPVVSKHEISGIPFYLVIYPDKNSGEKPELAMEFSRDGQVLGSGHPSLAAPDASGRIPYVATAPVGQLQPGSYQIRFVVKQGAELAQQTTSFTLTP